eukprot:1159330-Pelagomonas_calceolata.AAC.12
MPVLAGSPAATAATAAAAAAAAANGLSYMPPISGVVSEDELAKCLGRFLHVCPRLNKVAIGELLGEPDAFYLKVCIGQCLVDECRVPGYLLHLCTGWDFGRFPALRVLGRRIDAFILTKCLPRLTCLPLRVQQMIHIKSFHGLSEEGGGGGGDRVLLLGLDPYHLEDLGMCARPCGMYCRCASGFSGVEAAFRGPSRAAFAQTFTCSSGVGASGLDTRLPSFSSFHTYSRLDWLQVLDAYTASFNFHDLRFDAAIRLFLESFRLPGEAQKIDRIINSFGNHFYDANPGIFRGPDAAYVLAYSVIMLNTDRHNAQVRSFVVANVWASRCSTLGNLMCHRAPHWLPQRSGGGQGDKERQECASEKATCIQQRAPNLASWQTLNKEGSRGRASPKGAQGKRLIKSVEGDTV